MLKETRKDIKTSARDKNDSCEGYDEEVDSDGKRLEIQGVKKRSLLSNASADTDY